MRTIQTSAVFLDRAVVTMELPSEDCEVIPGVTWGLVEAFPSPAYWAYQVLARRLVGNTIVNKIGVTLREEVAACLLGGHGIPAHIGLLAFEHLKRHRVFEGASPSEANIYELLSEPMPQGERFLRYRFAKQKARYLHAALTQLDAEDAPLSSGKALRDWLLVIPGIGPKTASWIARNWLDADDVAILDIHILRAGHLGGFFDRDLTVERHYSQLESQFLKFSAGLGVRASELDAVIWAEMMSNPSIVHELLAMPEELDRGGKPGTLRRGTDEHDSDSGKSPAWVKH